MPEDKPYIQRVYKFLNSAYGPNGAVSPGAFTMSFEKFSNKISTSDKYANKIYGALMPAYGPNGSVKRDAFTSTIEDFMGKVMTPKQSAKAAVPAPTTEAPQVVSPASATAQPPPTGPVGALLSRAMDLQLPEQQALGVMADQSAIEPLIAKQQAQEDADLARGKQLLLQPKSELAIDMSGNQPAPTDQEISIQDRLHQMDEQDKNLQSAQGEADEFAKTTAGGLYYSFVRPIYQSLVGTGGNLLAGTARISGDLGESLGLDDSKKVLDKVADGLTDYFDFHRIAKEGGSSGYLNMTPTTQQGAGLNKANILPKAIESITSMATLIGGGRVLGGNSAALFTSNYLATYEDFRKQAKDAGLSNGEADQFAITSAGVNSALLMISPETFLGKSKALPLAEKNVFNAIKNGVSVKDAVRNGVKNGMKTLGEANAIVLSTDVANRVLRTGADLVTGEHNFNESSLAPSMSEALETTVLTSIAMGALNGGKIRSENKPSNLERSAWAQAAERPELIENGINKATEAGTLPAEQAQKIRTDVAEYKEIYDALKVQLADRPGADIPRIALDALRSKKQSEQAKPLSGIPALKSITEQADIEQAQTESDIKDGLAGIPELGEQITSGELKILMAESGGEGKLDKVSERDYKADMISLDELYKSNAQFKFYVDAGRLKESDNKEGLRMPVVINADGSIVDGMNRLAQQYKDGNNTARAFIETKPSSINVERSVNKPRIVKVGEGKTGISVERPNKPNIIEKIKQPDVTTELSEQRPVPISEVDPATERVLEENPRTELEAVIPVEPTGNTPQAEARLTVQPEVADMNVADLTQPVETKTVKPKSVTEAKARRDLAVEKLKTAYNNLGNIGVISDPTRTAKQQIEFNKALVHYAKEEILYRANQVNNFGKLKKAQIKSSIRRAMNAEGVKMNISEFTDAFNEAYAQIKKIPGVLGQNVDRITMREYIKGKILVREKGRQEGFKAGRAEGEAATKREVVEQFKAVKGAINDVLKDTGVNLSMMQKRRVISMLQQSLTAKNINKSIERAIDATTQMVWEAQHKVQIVETKKLIKSVNGLKRSKYMVLQDVEWIRQLQLPSPTRVDDLGTYQAMLRDFTSSRRGNNTNPKYTKEEISEFIHDENTRIYKEKQEGMQSDLEALKEQGVMPDDVTLDEYIATLDNATPPKLSEGISKKAEILRGDLKPRMGYLKDRLPEFQGEEKSVVNKLAEVDISDLDGTELVRLNNVLNNIAEYGTLDAAGDIITSHEARVMNKELAASGDKLRALPADKILSKKNLSNYISALFYNDAAISRFRAKVLGGVENKTSHVKGRAQKVVKDFVALNKKHKINGLSNAKLFAYSYLNQYRGIESGEITDNLKQRLDELISDATYLFDKGSAYTKKAERQPLVTDATNRLEALKEMGLLDYSVINGKLKVDVKEFVDTDNPTASLDKIHTGLTEGEKSVYKFVRDHYDELTERLSFVTRTYAGKEFQNERNYVSLVARPKNAVEDMSSELSGNTDITGHLQSINAKPANTTISRSNKKGSDVYYDGDFFSNFVNRYYTSLYTVEVLPDLQRTAKAVNSPEFKKFITGQFDIGSNRNTDHNYVKFKEKLSEAINEEKYAPFFKKGKEAISDRVISRGVRMVLGNVWQGPKQYVPALLHNFTINNTKAVAYAIAARGKSIMDPAIAAARKEFLKNFTGVQRSTLGSAAYDEYVKSVNDEATFATNTTAWLDKADKVSSFVLEKADRMAQNDAYTASYITSLLRQGKISSVLEFDFAKEAANPNKEALAYSEQMASNINNESAKAYRPETLKDSEKSKYLWLLQGFSLNAYQNAMNKLKIISDNRSTSAEKKEAAAHFMGYAAEVGTYQLVGKTARGLQMTIAAALLSSVFGFEHKETDEEKVEKKKKENIKTGANIAADFALSGLNAAMQGAIKITANYAYGQWAKAQVAQKKKAAKAGGGKFDPRGTYLSPYFKPYYGVEGPGGAADFYSNLMQKGVDEVEKGANMFDSKETVEDGEAKKLAKNLNLYLGIPGMVLGSGDLMLLNTRMQTILKEAAKKEKKPAASGGSSRGASRGRSTRSRSNR